MSFFFQELVNGITTGALYSLVALGFSMVYGVLKLLNFAHGDLYMVGAQYRVYNTADFISLSSGIQIGSVTIDSVQILVLVLGVLLMTGLQLLVNRTRLGRQMRAVAADREAAEMLGINVNFVITATFFLGSALAGVAGIMGGLLFNQVTSTIGFIAGLKAFTAAVVGGIGSIPGAMLGGLFIGVAESFVTGYISSTYSNLIVFGILIVVMLVRPSGLLGRAPLQKVGRADERRSAGAE